MLMGPPQCRSGSMQVRLGFIRVALRRWIGQIRSIGFRQNARGIGGIGIRMIVSRTGTTRRLYVDDFEYHHALPPSTAPDKGAGVFPHRVWKMLVNQ